MKKLMVCVELFPTNKTIVIGIGTLSSNYITDGKILLFLILSLIELWVSYYSGKGLWSSTTFFSPSEDPN